MPTTETCVPPIAKENTEASSLTDVFAFPVSSGQQRLWFLEQFQPGSPLYNSPVAVRLEGPLEAAVLEQAVNQIIRRHEILRTSFDLQNGQPVQVVAPSLPLTESAPRSASSSGPAPGPSFAASSSTAHLSPSTTCRRK